MTDKNDIIKAIATNNNCYKYRSKLVPTGIVIHSTGANNPNLKRYVDAPDEVGVNKYANHWNTPTPGGREVCVHAFIGKDIKGDVRVAQILPYDVQCWGCGSGKNGSYNISHVQFEICEDGLNDQKYFTNAFELAASYCAYLCRELGISPDSIVSHAEAHKLGYASNHADPEHWMNKFGLTMDGFRAKVRAKCVVLSKKNYADIVCKKCGFIEETRQYLDSYTYAEDLWRKLYEQMR